jgi:hypothetical protein
MSCKNRGIRDTDLKGKLIKKVIPKILLDLVLSTDKSLIYYKIFLLTHNKSTIRGNSLPCDEFGFI